MSSVPNRLVHEQSLYLRQHAYNPVDWYPWGEEAFAQARERDIPIFLSIGYAACHWCHVMEHQCFEDEQVAALLNQHFIAIKVDREEQPDIDHIYMSVCQAMTGSGGWPLSLFLTPDKRPFYAGTFIPRDSTPGMAGMLDILPHIVTIWSERRNEIANLSHRVLEAVGEIRYVARSGLDTLAEGTAQILSRAYDSRFGGFGSAPKFPSVPTLLFLLRYAGFNSDKTVLKQVCYTLDRMALSGIRDHLDGGFHRYATDAAWKLPHFEKMLYDQAMCAIIYTEAWQATKKDWYRIIATGALEYMISSLSDPEGGFYSSEDADSPGGEGAYYLWSYEDFIAVLGDDAAYGSAIFGVTREGNVSRMHGMKYGDNVLYPEQLLRYPSEKDTPFQDPRYIRIIQKLQSARNIRPRPATDDKVLSDWTGMAIHAMVLAGMAFQESRYLKRAEEAGLFLTRTMIREDGSIFHRYRKGVAGIPGTANDYVYTAWAFWMLYQATGNEAWLPRCIALEQEAGRRFCDPEDGGYYLSGPDAGLPVRLKDIMDGPYPSINGTAYRLLTVLGGVTGQDLYSDKIKKMEDLFSKTDIRSGAGITSFLAYWYEKEHEVRAVIYGESKTHTHTEMENLLWTGFIPGLIRIPVTPQSYEHDFQFLPGFQKPDTATQVALCAGEQCYLPVTSVETLGNLLQKLEIFEGNEVSDPVQPPD